MPQQISAEMIEAAYAEDGEAFAVLATLDAPGLAEPIRATNYPGGIISSGVDYRHFPFRFTGGGWGENETAREARLEIANVDRRITEAVRSVGGNAQPTLTIETVRVSAPDVVETALVGATVHSARIEAGTAVATVKPRSFDTEPACKAAYVPALTPALFP